MINASVDNNVLLPPAARKGNCIAFHGLSPSLQHRKAAQTELSVTCGSGEPGIRCYQGLSICRYSFCHCDFVSWLYLMFLVVLFYFARTE